MGARIMGLQEPTAKMSKSGEVETDALYLLDQPDIITRKIRRAVTDLGNDVRFDEKRKPGVSNLMSILSATTGESFDSIVSRFDGQGYGKLKDAVAEAVVECLEPVQKRYQQIRGDEEGLRRILRDAAARASRVADATLARVHDRLGFIPES
jgi:tryptophanyl-tRNA synthetase